jgi:hypothetical protein
MTTPQVGTLVFKDQAGHYFLVPQDVVEQGRVSQQHQGVMERLLDERRDDVQGYIISDNRPIHVQWVTGTVDYVRSIVYPNQLPISWK